MKLSYVDDLLARRMFIVSDCMNVVRDISEKTSGTYGAINQEISERAEGFEECHDRHEGRNCDHGAQHTTCQNLLVNFM